MLMSKKILLSIFIFLFLVGVGFFSVSVNQVSAGGIVIPTNTGLPDPADTTGQGPVVQVAINVMKWVLSIFTLLAVIAFVYTGIMYLTTSGDTYKAESAKNSLVYSIIGVAVVAGALVLVYTIDALLR